MLAGVCEDVAGELQKTIDFFHATSGSEKVDTIVLSGGGSRVGQLDEVLKDRFGLPVEIMNPFRSVVAEDRSVDPAWLSENGPSLAIGVGLAVRKLGE